VDANGRFDVDTAIAYAKALAPYGLHWYEEAGDPLDYELQSKLAEHYPGPMATGENLFSMPDARNLIRYGGMRSDRDILQFDCALSYGLVEYCERWNVERVRLVAEALHSARRPSVVAEYRGGTGAGRQRILSGHFSTLRRFSRTAYRWKTVPLSCLIFRASDLESKNELFKVMDSLAKS